MLLSIFKVGVVRMAMFPGDERLFLCVLFVCMCFSLDNATMRK